jgi:predicted ABC-type ATPase
MTLGRPPHSYLIAGPNGAGKTKIISDLKRSGYVVTLIFLWLPAAEMATERVANRVSQGGHDVPEPTIRRRFNAGLRNSFRRYASFVNVWHLYDGSQLPPSLIAHNAGGPVQAKRPELYQVIQKRWGK